MQRSSPGGNTSSRSGNGNGSGDARQEDELHRAVRLLLQRGRAAAAAHVLQEDWAQAGGVLEDAALRCAGRKRAEEVPAQALLQLPCTPSQCILACHCSA